MALAPSWLRRLGAVMRKYMRFIGPGLMVLVAYMDPGNYSTAVAAGLAYQYKLLFSIFLSNCLAIFLQILSAKLGAVTGLDLAANCRKHLPPRWNLVLYALAEIAIIATDLAEVVGTAIALNILFGLPLVAGVVVTVVDVLVVLMAYRPNGPLLFIRLFESFVLVLVAATVVCFAVELAQVSHDPDFSVGKVLNGFLPNSKVVDMSEREGGNGLFLSLAILGATVMPHLLYLGSGLVQARLKDYDVKHGHYIDKPEDTSDGEPYRPLIYAIRDTMTYTIVELVISLFTVALFVNATILIVAGATLGSKHDDLDLDLDLEGPALGDLYTIYNLLLTHLLPTAGFVFALALLCLGQSAGVVCTLAGQMVSEGFLLWSFSPVVRRLVTRAIAILPCLVVVMVAGREGLARTLNALQVVLLVMLPFVTAPLIWFTCLKLIMRVPIGDADGVAGPFSSSEPAIRLQDLRNAHPCAGWEDDTEDELHEHQQLVLKLRTPREPELAETHTISGDTLAPTLTDEERRASHSDMSNGPTMAVLAVGVWGFVTSLNVFLLGSMLLGYEVPL